MTGSNVLKIAASKIRGVLGLGVIGAGIGFLLSGTFGFVVLLVERGLPLDLARLATGVVPWTLLGGFTGLGLGVLIAITAASRRLEELPLWKMAVFGALAGALFIPAYYLVVGGWRSSLLPFVGVTAALGGILSTSMVALAKRAHRNELSAGAKAEVLLDAEHTASRGSAEGIGG